MVDVAAAADGYVVGEKLEGDSFEDGEQEFGVTGDVDDVVYQLGDRIIAPRGYRDDAAGAGGDFLDVGRGFSRV